MPSINLLALAESFVLEKSEHIGVRLEIAKSLLSNAVAYVNADDDDKRDEIMQHAIDIGESMYPMVMPDMVFDKCITDVQSLIHNAGWDKRLVVKTTFKAVGGNYFNARIEMDLEATGRKLGWIAEETEEVEEDTPQKALATTAIKDNPTLDDINAFNRQTRSRPRAREPKLSDRGGKFIQNGEGRNKRLSDR